MDFEHLFKELKAFRFDLRTFGYVHFDDAFEVSKVSKEWCELIVRTLQNLKTLSFKEINLLHSLTKYYNWEEDYILNLRSVSQLMVDFHFEEDFLLKLSKMTIQPRAVKFCHIERTYDFNWDLLRPLCASMEHFSWEVWREFGTNTEGNFPTVQVPLTLLAASKCLRSVRINGGRLKDTNQSWRGVIPASVEKLQLEGMILDDSVRSLFNLTYACKSPNSLRKLVIFACNDFPALQREDFRALTNLRSLNLSTNEDGDQTALLALKHCPRLEEIDLCCFEITMDWYKSIPSTVRTMSLAYCKATPDVDPLVSLEFLCKSPDCVKSFRLQFVNQRWYNNNWKPHKLEHLTMKSPNGYVGEREAGPSIPSNPMIKLITDSCLSRIHIDYCKVDSQWYKIMPGTVKRLEMVVDLEPDFAPLFAVEYVCQNPGALQNLTFASFDYIETGMKERCLRACTSLEECALSLKNTEATTSAFSDCPLLKKLTIEGWSSFPESVSGNTIESLILSDISDEIPLTFMNLLPSLKKLCVSWCKFRGSVKQFAVVTERVDSVRLYCSEFYPSDILDSAQMIAHKFGIYMYRDGLGHMAILSAKRQSVLRLMRTLGNWYNGAKYICKGIDPVIAFKDLPLAGKAS